VKEIRGEYQLCDNATLLKSLAIEALELRLVASNICANARAAVEERMVDNLA